MSHPVTVVSDDGECLAVLLEPGSPFTFEPHHGIDIVIPADGSRWKWKDVDDPAQNVVTGRTTQAEADQILVDAALVARALDAGDPWWASWDGWTPAAALSTSDTRTVGGRGWRV